MSGLAGPCFNRLSTEHQSCVVPEDDFAFAGVETDLECARRQMEKSFLVKVIGRLRGDEQYVHELRVLNRVLSWKGTDPRHQEILISELEQDMRGLSTLGVKNQQRKDGLGVGDVTPLNEAEPHKF